MNYRKLIALLLAVFMLAGTLSGCSAEDVRDTMEIVSDVVEIISESEEQAASESAQSSEAESPEAEPGLPVENAIDEDGTYTTKEDVALYIYTYGCLPQNFVTKNQARDAGWSGGGLEKYLPGMCIGGDRFGNREGLLPDAPGRTWTECDVNTLGASSRGAERIVFSNDGLIYYTGDHYESFELLYGNP